MTSSLTPIAWAIYGLLGLLALELYFIYLKLTTHSINEPSLIPYKWPYIGHTLEFLKDQRGFFAKANQMSKGQPFTMILDGSKSYVFSRPKDVETIYGMFNNRNHTQDGVKQFRTNVLGFNSKDADIVANLRVEENKIHSVFLLRSRQLSKLTSRYLSYLDEYFRKFTIDLDYSYVRDFNGFVFAGDAIMPATLNTFFGRNAFSPWIYKDLFADFRKFLSISTAYRYFGVPLVPLLFDRSPLVARERIKACLRKAMGKKSFSKYSRGKIDIGKKAGISHEGLIANEFDTIVAGNINTIPISYIALLHLFSNEDLLSQIRKELEDARYGHLSVQERATLDYKHIPRLRALFHEVLRFHSTSVSMRELKEDKTLTFPSNGDNEERTYKLKKGYQLPGFLSWFAKNNVITMPSPLLHHNPEIHENPDVFDPNRFLSVEKGGKGTPVISATLRPFGGGSSHCPGRVFAEKQVIGFLAAVCLRFDIGIVSKGWEMPKNSDFWFVTGLPDIVLRFSNREGESGRKHEHGDENEHDQESHDQESEDDLESDDMKDEIDVGTFY